MLSVIYSTATYVRIFEIKYTSAKIYVTNPIRIYLPVSPLQKYGYSYIGLGRKNVSLWTCNKHKGPTTINAITYLDQ